MKARRILAIFKKQIKDTIKNPMILILFVFFPIMSIILTETVAKSTDKLPDTYFAVLFATIFIGLVPMVNISNVIAEEKEKNTLGVLMMSNVKPLEYLLGVGMHLFVLCLIGIFLFGFVGGFKGIELLRFTLSLMIGVVASLLLGAAIGMLSKNQMSANGIAVPFAVLSAFLPMIAGFSASFESISKYLYTQQINYLIKDLSPNNFSFERFVIIALNMLIFLTSPT